MTDRRPEPDAIRVHSGQAALFRDRYEALVGDPYGSCFAYSRHRLQRQLERLLPTASRDGRLLDVGCGTGYHMQWTEARGFRVTGIDGSEAMLQEARRLNPSAQLRRAQVDALPFKGATFDVVLCIEVLRYLPDVDPCIHEMARVLGPGGACLATASPLFNLSGFPLLNRVGVRLPFVGVVRLKQFFHTTAGLRRRFRRAGFRRVHVHGVYLGPVNWVERLRPQALPTFLRAYERFDAALSDLPLLRDLSAMLLVHATR